MPGGPGHEHQFSPISGWCAWCNLRDDGLLVDRGGNILRHGRDYTHEELQAIRARTEKALQ